MEGMAEKDRPVSGPYGGLPPPSSRRGRCRHRPLHGGTICGWGTSPPLCPSTVFRFPPIQAGAAGALRSKPPPPEDHQENSLGEVPRRGNRNSPFLAVSRGGLLRRGKSASPALTGSFAPFWPLRKGPAGGLTRKQVSKRVPMEGAPARHKAGRCRQKVNCPREAKEAAPTVERTAHKTQPVSGPYLRRNTWTRKEARTRRPSRAASRSAPSLGVFQ